VRGMHHITMSPTLVFAQQVMTTTAPDRRMSPEWAQWPRRRAKCRPLPGEVLGSSARLKGFPYAQVRMYMRIAPFHSPLTRIHSPAGYSHIPLNPYRCLKLDYSTDSGADLAAYLSGVWRRPWHRQRVKDVPNGLRSEVSPSVA
jgi:hypothetical protein